MFNRFLLGSVDYPNGDKYEGQLLDLEPHGWGRLASPGDKNFYRGLFEKGVKNGCGWKAVGDQLCFFDYEKGKERSPVKKGKQPASFWNNLKAKTRDLQSELETENEKSLSDFKRKQDEFLKKLSANAVNELQNQMLVVKDFRKEIKKGGWMSVRKEEIDDFILQLSEGLLNEQQRFTF